MKKADSVVTLSRAVGVGLRHASRETHADSRHPAHGHATGGYAVSRCSDVRASAHNNFTARHANRRDAHLDRLDPRFVCVER